MLKLPERQAGRQAARQQTPTPRRRTTTRRSIVWVVRQLATPCIEASSRLRAVSSLLACSLVAL